MDLDRQNDPSGTRGKGWITVCEPQEPESGGTCARGWMMKGLAKAESAARWFWPERIYVV